MVGITTLLTHEIVAAQEPIKEVVDLAGIHAQAQQQSQGDAGLLYSRELSLSVSIFLIIVLICVAAVLVRTTIRKKVCRRIISVAELGEVKHFKSGGYLDIFVSHSDRIEYMKISV